MLVGVPVSLCSQLFDQVTTNKYSSFFQHLCAGAVAHLQPCSAVSPSDQRVPINLR